jgi:hypothetical protein
MFPGFGLLRFNLNHDLLVHHFNDDLVVVSARVDNRIGGPAPHDRKLIHNSPALQPHLSNLAKLQRWTFCQVLSVAGTSNLKVSPCDPELPIEVVVQCGHRKEQSTAQQSGKDVCLSVNWELLATGLA